MPVWSIPYILFLMMVTAASTALKRRLGFPWWWGVLDTLSIAVLLWLFVAYFVPDALGGLARAAPPLFGLVLVWLGVSTHRELRVVEQLPILQTEEAAGAQWISLLGGVLLLTPALGFGAIAAVRAWP